MMPQPRQPQRRTPIGKPRYIPCDSADGKSCYVVYGSGGELAPRLIGHHMLLQLAMVARPPSRNPAARE